MAISELKRHRQRMELLRLLYKNGEMSATALSREIAISLPTTRGLLDELIAGQLIENPRIGKSVGGRKPQIYSLRPQSFYVFVVEMGHYRASAVLANSRNEWLSPVVEFDTHIHDVDLADKLADTLAGLLADSGVEASAVRAVGISMPGLIDSERGINKTIKETGRQEVGSLLAARFGVPVFIENDARMQALGELEFGTARGTRNALVINWSWGLGLGMIFNGEIYRGACGSAGELSHIRVADNGKLCECGKRGCLETVAGAMSLVETAREEIALGTASQLTARFASTPELLTPADIIDCARKGDELSITLLREIGTRLAWGLSILIQLHNPELIVVNGLLSDAGHYVLIPIRQALNQYCLQNMLEHVRVELSEVDGHFGLKGVNAMVFNRLLAG